jgi:hypothetical protein
MLLYAPFFIFARSVYTQSVELERSERLKLKVHSLKSDASALNMRLVSLRRDIDRLVSNPAIERSLRVYHDRDALTRKSLIKYIAEKKAFIIQGGIVEEMVFVTNQRDILTASHYFKSVVEDIDLSMDYDYELVDFNRFDGYMNTKLFFLKSISTGDEKDLHSLLIFVVDKKKLIGTMASAYNDAVGFMDAKQQDIVYSQKLRDEFKMALRKINHKNQAEILGKVILTEKLSAFNWTVYSIVDSNNLIAETKTNFQTHMITLFVFALMSSVAIAMIFLISTELRNEKEIAVHKFQISEDANHQLRVYKHDLMNHLQVIHGLIEMDRYDKAMAYIQKVGHEGAAIQNRYLIGIPELEAAIFSQLSDCEAYGIQTEIDCIVLDDGFGYDVYELSKILTNLIKNATEALKKYDKVKILKVEIKKVASKYVFIVTNSGPIIDDDKKERIFQYGYSDKGDHRGYGLYIVRTAIEKLGGKLRLELDLSGNHFIVELPVDKKVIGGV